jgi:hypothetical protein
MKYAAVVALFLSGSTQGVKLSSKSRGFPVLVNPESTLYTNTQAATEFGFVDIPVGLDELSFAQTNVEGTPVYVNPESTLYSNT